MPRHILAGGAVLAALLPAAADAQAGCANADALAAQATIAELRSAVVCLVNDERRGHGRPVLRSSDRLTLAGQRHATDMVRRHYFSPQARSGLTLRQRLRGSGYTGALIGESLAWGSDDLGTPRAIVRAWMQGSARAIVLNGRFREIGVGVVRDAPTGAGNAATYTAEFGREAT
jgi:uncharacterized protein YkwD